MQVGPKKAAGVLKARGEVNLHTRWGVEVEILSFFTSWQHLAAGQAHAILDFYGRAMMILGLWFNEEI